MLNQQISILSKKKNIFKEEMPNLSMHANNTVQGNRGKGHPPWH